MQGVCYIDLVRDNRKGGVLSRYCSWRKNQSSDLPSLFSLSLLQLSPSSSRTSLLFLSCLCLFDCFFSIPLLIPLPARVPLHPLFLPGCRVFPLPPLFFVYDRIFLVIEAFRFSLCIPFHYWRLYSSSSSSSSRNLDSLRFVVFPFPPFYCLLDTPRCVFSFLYSFIRFFLRRLYRYPPQFLSYPRF